MLQSTPTYTSLLPDFIGHTGMYAAKRTAKTYVTYKEGLAGKLRYPGATARRLLPQASCDKHVKCVRTGDSAWHNQYPLSAELVKRIDGCAPYASLRTVLDQARFHHPGIQIHDASCPRGRAADSRCGCIHGCGSELRRCIVAMP